MRIGKLKNYDENIIYISLETEPYVLVNEIDNNLYDDITSAENFEKIFFNKVDSKRFIWLLNGYMNDVGFDNLSYNEKVIMCNYIIVDYTIAINYISEEQFKERWSIMNILNKNSRQKRWNALFDLLAFELTKSNGFDLVISIQELKLDDYYLKYGLESNLIDGVPGLWDYFENTSIFSINGFSSKPYYSLNLQNKIMKILKEGIY